MGSPVANRVMPERAQPVATFLPSRNYPPVKRQQPVVAENETLGDVEIAKRDAAPRIKRISGILQAGSVVHALAVGIAGAEAQ